MTVNKIVQVLTHQEASVRVSGTDGSAIIDLAKDLVHPTQSVTSLPKVNIVGVTWAGEDPGMIKVIRNNVTVMILMADAATFLDFEGQNCYPESTENASNIEVQISKAECQVWLKLRKISGYVSSIEIADFGAHDDPTKIGS